jgi:hypothetical protein
VLEHLDQVERERVNHALTITISLTGVGLAVLLAIYLRGRRPH